MKVSKLLLRNGMILLGLFILLFINSQMVLAQAWKWPSTLTIATTGLGSASYAILSAWTPVMEQMTGMKVRVRPDDNKPLTQKWLQSGAVDMYMDSVSQVASFGMEAKEGHATRDGGPFQIRIVWLGQSLPYGFMVRGDSEIRTLYDIKPRHRIAYYTAAAAAASAMDALLAWAKIDKKEVTVVPFTNWAANIRAIAEGKADVAYITTTSPAAFEAEANPKGVRLLELPYKKDPEGAKRFSAIRPTLVFGICRDGIKSAIGVPTMITPFYLFTTDKMDSATAYHITKWLHENYNAYKDKHLACKLMSMDLFRESLDSTYLPIHEGTIRYLKEVGKWISKDDVRQKYNVELLTKYENAYKAAIAEADSKKINVDPRNKEWVDLWDSFKKDIPPFKLMSEIP